MASSDAIIAMYMTIHMLAPESRILPAYARLSKGCN
jgi:hypothetical protein